MDFSWIASPWVLGIAVVFSLLIGFIIYKAASISISKQGIVVNQGKSSVQKVSPHANCPHAKDIMEIIHRTIDYSEKRLEVKTNLVGRQMKYYEEVEEEIAGSFKRTFLALLSTKLETEVESLAQHPEYMAFIVTLKAISLDLKPYIKNCFKSNHYATQTQEDQRIYIDRKRALIIQKVTEYLNLYWRGTVVTRTDLYKANHKEIRIYENYLEEIFNRAFMLAREASDTLLHLEEEYKKYIDTIT